ncbi:hypothetical protein SAMN02949497_2785 [Methylomagnum ishizawai]|uniref:Uncharacterized protein n=1 Tax=Methylomagnum ishizawai TaxID=1760988 RepID=A0A1Y6D4F7_9GAMM|nr:hypothetical protein [Methylomagnum ishizawai]SMF95422.1 hypothetical protein SAMN02949497_2785 [Methylomagnum ishizawai]
MNTSIDRLAHRFHGSIDEKAGSVVVCFRDPGAARECARAIESSTQRKVALCGCRIVIEGDGFLEQLRQAGL